MKKTSEELIANAKKLLAKAKKIEEARAIKVGKIMIELFNDNKITDEVIFTKIKSIMHGTSRANKCNDVLE